MLLLRMQAPAIKNTQFDHSDCSHEAHVKLVGGNRLVEVWLRWNVHIIICETALLSACLCHNTSFIQEGTAS